MNAITQPQIDPSLRLLHVGYDQDGLLLDLYGSLSSYGYIVETVALTGQKIDLFEMVKEEQLGQMDAWCDRNLPSARQLGDGNEAEIQIENMQEAHYFSLAA